MEDKLTKILDKIENLILYGEEQRAIILRLQNQGITKSYSEAHLLFRAAELRMKWRER